MYQLIISAECHFRFNHPEFAQVLLRVAILSPERRPEGLHVTQPHAILLYIQLPAARQHCLLPEEVLLPVHNSLATGQSFDITNIVLHERCDLEQLPRTLAVGCGYDRRVDLQESVVVEEFVRGVRECVSDPCNCTDDVGPDPEVWDGSECLHVDPAFAQRVFLI